MGLGPSVPFSRRRPLLLSMLTLTSRHGRKVHQGDLEWFHVDDSRCHTSSGVVDGDAGGWQLWSVPAQVPLPFGPPGRLEMLW